MAKKNRDDDANDVEGDIIGNLERLARLMRSAAHAEGLIPAQWEALRFLSKANAFSNSPGVLARYLDATKGTVSQTVAALAAKGLISKKLRDGDERSVVLAVTAAGEALLSRDPLLHIAKSIENLGGKTQRRLARGLEEVLAGEIKRLSAQAFGTCKTCKHFTREGEAQARCNSLEVPLSDAMFDQLCVHFAA